MTEQEVQHQIKLAVGALTVSYELFEFHKDYIINQYKDELLKKCPTNGNRKDKRHFENLMNNDLRELTKHFDRFKNSSKGLVSKFDDGEFSKEISNITDKIYNIDL